MYRSLCPLTAGLLCVAVLAAAARGASSPVRLPAIRAAEKPDDALGERRARKQPTVPGNYKETPFAEEAPEPELTPRERERGFMLFGRPITEPVHPNSRPLPHERLEGLVAFATPGEFEPVTFGIYPVREMKNLRVRASALECDAGTIGADELTVRLVTYWNVGYPRYTSRSTYRRLPELMERVTVHTSPARECQRYWITIHVPEDAEPGLYRGKVTVWDDGGPKAVEIPVALRVLGFELKRDPAKHYSAYYYVRNGVQYRGKDVAFIKKATGNDYRAMAEYGIDMVPTLYLRTTDGRKMVVPHAEELERMMAAGMSGPVPVTAGGVIARLYRDTTPGGERGKHWKINKMPPPEFYARITKIFKNFETERKKKGWPEFICCPIDEVTASCKEFGAGVYKAVKAGGMRTYATKNPLAADAAVYRPHLDIWCSQPYSTPYEKITAQKRYEYWSYPNHNAGEVKDRVVMCKGGRMTYGFGLWRSGFTTLIPWHWAWTPAPDQFDYLRGSRSGCGQRIGDDGEVIPAVYWECFREGRDDARYVYTLQQAVFEREGSRRRGARSALAAANTLLQKTWDDINVQQKYLAAGMWPSEEFDARRWRLALATEKLLGLPAAREGTAPSVLVGDTSPKAGGGRTSFIEEALKQGNMESKDLGGDFSAWKNVTGEGAVSVTTEAGKGGRKGLRWRVKVDHKTDGGGEAGQYPVGWPRVYRAFARGELDMSSYDYIHFLMRVDSDRDEVADDSTPLGFTVHTNKFFETTRDLGGRQRVWLPVLFTVKDMIETVGRGVAPWRSIEKVQFFIAESKYAHGDNLTFDVAEVKLLRFKSPMISELDAPRYVMLPRKRLPVSFEVMGTGSVKKGSHTAKADLLDGRGTVAASASRDLSEPNTLVLDASRVKPGSYRLRLRIATAAGETCSESERQMETLAGPLYVR